MPQPVRVEWVLLDRLDRCGNLRRQLSGDRSGTGSGCCFGLALFAGDVANVSLDELGVSLVRVLLARDDVAHQDERVSAGLGGGAVELDGDVVVGTALNERRCVDNQCGGLSGVVNELFANLDRGNAEVSGLGSVGVTDGVGAVGYCVNNTRGALSSFATGVGESVFSFCVPDPGATLPR